MSASEPVSVAGVSSLGDPLAAFAEALSQTQRAFFAAGGAPPLLTSAVWSGPDPGALHPSRLAVDRAWREAFGGFRPPVAIRRSEVTRIELTARPPPPPDPALVWRGYSRAELGRQYSPRGQADMETVFAAWTRDGAATRARIAARDIAYGPGRAQTLDLHRPPGAGRPPLFAFIHGGYWQASSKEQHSQFLGGLVAAGFAVANLEYGLAPETPLDGIVADIALALRFLVREQGALGVDAGRLFVGGHSAGGHLAAEAALLDDGPPVAGVLLLSGLFELEPLALLPVGPLLGLDRPGAVAALSPIRRRPPPGTKVAVAVGGAESAEFIRQSQEMAEAWAAPPVLVVPGANHFALLDHLAQGAVLDLALTLR